MRRENSFSDDGRSLTPDLDEEVDAYAPGSPTYRSPRRPSYPPNLQNTSSQDAMLSSPPAAYPSSPRRNLPKERFRLAVRKIIALHRGTKVMARPAAGAEPGVDPRRANADAEYGQIKQDCVIQIVDYSAVRSSVRPMGNREFVRLMSDPDASKREPWVKVRWINIGGISWDVIKAVALRYDLSPLALEDIFHGHARARSKADYYTQHLFLRILCHELGEDELLREIRASRPHHQRPISAGPPRESAFPTSLAARRRRPWPHRQRSTPALALAALQAVVAPGQELPVHPEDVALQALKSGERVNVGVIPMYIFLLRDGTVITIHATPSLRVTEPIAARLRQFDTKLRTSADASLLVQSLLGLVADMALEVVDAYQAKIQRYERKILTKPTIETVRNLHILSADLLLYRRTLEPIKTVVYALRRYDVDRVAALLDTPALENKDVKVAGFMSHNSIIYLADVHDHLEYVLGQLEVIAGVGQNLVDYTFNMTSYEMNEVMRRLALVTIIFLPLTLLAGYFGMNFQSMWSTLHCTNPDLEDPTQSTGCHSDVIYWIIALPVMAIVMPLFLGPDIKRGIHFMRKKLLTRKAVKTFKTA